MPIVVSGYLGRAKVAKLSWPLAPELHDELLIHLIRPEQVIGIARNG